MEPPAGEKGRGVQKPDRQASNNCLGVAVCLLTFAISTGLIAWWVGSWWRASVQERRAQEEKRKIQEAELEELRGKLSELVAQRGGAVEDRLAALAEIGLLARNSRQAATAPVTIPGPPVNFCYPGKQSGDKAGNGWNAIVLQIDALPIHAKDADPAAEETSEPCPTAFNYPLAIPGLARLYWIVGSRGHESTAASELAKYHRHDISQEEITRSIRSRHYSIRSPHYGEVKFTPAEVAGVFDDLCRTRYVLVVSVTDYRAPSDEITSFTPGHVSAEALLFDVTQKRLLGSFTFRASSSSFVSYKYYKYEQGWRNYLSTESAVRDALKRDLAHNAEEAMWSAAAEHIPNVVIPERYRRVSSQ